MQNTPLIPCQEKNLSGRKKVMEDACRNWKCAVLGVEKFSRFHRVPRRDMTRDMLDDKVGQTLVFPQVSSPSLLTLFFKRVGCWAVCYYSHWWMWSEQNSCAKKRRWWLDFFVENKKENFFFGLLGTQLRHLISPPSHSDALRSFRCFEKFAVIHSPPSWLVCFCLSLL